MPLLVEFYRMRLSSHARYSETLLISEIEDETNVLRMTVCRWFHLKMAWSPLTHAHVSTKRLDKEQSRGALVE
jgi:hypothetical protein